MVSDASASIFPTTGMAFERIIFVAFSVAASVVPAIIPVTARYVENAVTIRPRVVMHDHFRNEETYRACYLQELH